MKILVGVCGIGIGHSTRQYELIKLLIERGHEVRILTFNRGIDFFRDLGLDCNEVWVPFIKYKGERIDYKSVVKLNYREVAQGLRKNRNIQSLMKRENFIPDICITDYEPITAKMAYRWKKPLFIIDQQSKFWEFTFENINGYSCREEKQRLDLFFPRYSKRFITTFYKLPDTRDPGVVIVAPIIRSDIKKHRGRKRDKNNIIVYFSEYGSVGIGQSLEELLDIFKKMQGYNFTFYTTRNLEKEGHFIPSNVTLCGLNRDNFCESLASAGAIITTAGHTLLSEAMYLEIPCYVIPLGTFDQHYCAKFIMENELGYSSYNITLQKLEQFLSLISSYESNIRTNEKLFLDRDPLQEIIQCLEEDTIENYYKC